MFQVLFKCVCCSDYIFFKYMQPNHPNMQSYPFYFVPVDLVKLSGMHIIIFPEEEKSRALLY